MSERLRQLLQKLIQSGAGNEMNNRHMQLLENRYSETKNLESVHDWLRVFLNMMASGMVPGRHPVYPDKLPSREVQMSRVGVLPLTSSMYFLMMQDSGLLPQIPKDSNVFQAIDAVTEAFLRLLNGKNIFYAPGRSGYEAKFAMKFGAQVGLITSGDYVQYAISTLSSVSHSAIPRWYIVDSKIEHMLPALAAVRKDKEAFHGISGTDSEDVTAYGNCDLAVAPDIIICVNMGNTERTRPDSSHRVNLPWQALVKNVLALGKPGTLVYFTPAIDYHPVYSPAEITDVIEDYGSIHFYDPQQGWGKSIVPSEGDFAFSVMLQKPVHPVDLE